MKKLVALLALVAFACTASANCGSCQAGGDKPAVKCEKCKDCKGDACKCKCHKKKEAPKAE
jgi:hypothetical protein